MARYTSINPVEFLEDLSEKVISESITVLSRGSMLLNSDGILVTDDIENEYVSRKDPPVVVETEYAQELSWLLLRLSEGMNDVVTALGRKVFYQKMARTANACIARGTDLTGLVQGILAQASLLQAQSLRSQLLSIKDELMARIEGKLREFISEHYAECIQYYCEGFTLPRDTDSTEYADIKLLSEEWNAQNMIDGGVFEPDARKGLIWSNGKQVLQ